MSAESRDRSPVKRRPPNGRSALLSLISQFTNSGGNVILTFAVARNATQPEYGAWAIGYAAFTMTLIGVRAIVGTPLLLQRHADDEALRRRARGATGLSAIAGSIAAVAFLVLAQLAPDVRDAGWAFALTMPLLTVQDAIRYFAFTRLTPRVAAIADSSWLVTQLILLISLELTGAATPASVTLAWGLAALPGALWFMIRIRIVPTWSSMHRFWRETRADAMKLLAEASIAVGVAQALPIVVALAAGLAAAGALRGGLTLVGLVGIFVSGLTPLATIAARREHDATGRSGRFLALWTTFLAVASLAFGVIVLLIPDDIGAELLGESWTAASGLLVPLVLQSMIRGPFTGVPIVLRASARLADALRLRIWTTVPSLLFPWAGAIAWGAEGAVWGILAGAICANVLSLVYLRPSPHRASTRGVHDSSPG